MEIIEQTNRTILFEEINPERLDIITLIGDTKGLESLSDEKMKEINEHLLVKNFDEFLDKFDPVVYSFYNANNQKVCYTLKKPESLPEDMVTEIPINQHNDFLKMLFTLIEAKRSQGTINVDFKFENLLDMISPKKVMDDIRQMRKEIQYTYGKYEELDEEDPTKLDVGDKLNVMFEDASRNYNNVMAMLPLAIEDIKTRLLLTGGGDGGDSEPLKVGMLSLGDKGELKIIEAPKTESTELATLGEGTGSSLSTVFEEDYEAVNDQPNDYVKSLVVRTFCPLPATATAEIDVETEVQNYNTYLEFFKASKDDFVKTVKPLVEKLLGVKMFFDQYTVKGKIMPPTLLVTNSKVDMLVKSNNLPRFVTFLNTTNDKTEFSNTIWYGIVPNIAMAGAGKVKLTRNRFKGHEIVENTEVNSMESLSTILDTVKDYGVQIFFSFEGKDETTFNHVATAGIEPFIDKCRALTRKDYSQYAIPCMPNFTIIPREKSGVILDNRMLVTEGGAAQLSKEKEDIMKLWIEGVYVGAAYVAAGLVAAYQCPGFLKEHKFTNVSTSYPGVRFDIEASNHALKATTSMAKEIYGFTNAIKSAINRQNFGFVFASENASTEGRDVKNITVYKARSLAEVDNEFESIYKTQMCTYLKRIMQYVTNDMKQDNVIKFFSNSPASQKSKWSSTNTYVNSILSEGDGLDYSIDNQSGICSIDVTFNGSVKNLEIDIKRKSAT